MHSDDGRVVSTFILQALQNEPLTVYGDGTQTRSFCFVSDMVDGLIKLMNSNDETLTPINLGNPNELTVFDIASQIIRSTQSQSKIVHQTLPQDDPKLRKPDITKAKAVLQWNPQIVLDEGLKRTIDYFRGQL
jgi:UDP-glucuronate decarboxylase